MHDMKKIFPLYEFDNNIYIYIYMHVCVCGVCVLFVHPSADMVI